MFVFSILVICFYNGHIVRTDNDVKYVGNKASIVPLNIPAFKISPYHLIHLPWISLQ